MPSHDLEGDALSRLARQYSNRTREDNLMRQEHIARMQQQIYAQAFNYPFTHEKKANRLKQKMSCWERTSLDDRTSLELLKTEGEDDWTVRIEQGPTRRSESVTISVKDRESAYAVLEILTRSVR